MGKKVLVAIIGGLIGFFVGGGIKNSFFLPVTLRK